MTLSTYFSSLTLEAQVLIAIAVIWLSGFLMSRVSKVFGLPNVTGYILAGVAIGPWGLNLLPPDITAHMSFITDAALAMIAFGVGRYMRLDILRDQGGRIILLTLLEALVAAVLVTLTMLFVFHLPLSTALLLGAIGSATAPASSLMTIRQYHAKGPFVNTLIQVVALDDAVALLAFSVCAAIAAGQEHTAQSWLSMLAPLATNLGVLLISYVLGRLLVVSLQGRSPDHRMVLTCAFIFLLAGGCAMVNVSPLLGCMVLGATYVNVENDKTLFKQVAKIQPPINMLFFVLSGMRLNISALTTVGIIGVAYFAIRIVGKYLGAYFGCRLIHSPDEVTKYLGLALIPQAGVSIGLAVLAQRILPPESGMLVNTIILSSSVLYEMIGPMSAKYALVRSGAIKTTGTGLVVPPAGTRKADPTLARASMSSPSPAARTLLGRNAIASSMTVQTPAPEHEVKAAPKSEKPKKGGKKAQKKAEKKAKSGKKPEKQESKKSEKQKEAEIVPLPQTAHPARARLFLLKPEKPDLPVEPEPKRA